MKLLPSDRCLAHALVAARCCAKRCFPDSRGARNFSACGLGLVPKPQLEWRQGRQAREYPQTRGDRYLRGLFVAGALAAHRYAKIPGTPHTSAPPGSRTLRVTTGGVPTNRIGGLSRASPNKDRSHGLGHDATVGSSDTRNPFGACADDRNRRGQLAASAEGGGGAGEQHVYGRHEPVTTTVRELQRVHHKRLPTSILEWVVGRCAEVYPREGAYWRRGACEPH